LDFESEGKRVVKGESHGTGRAKIERLNASPFLRDLIDNGANGRVEILYYLLVRKTGSRNFDHDCGAGAQMKICCIASLDYGW